MNTVEPVTVKHGGKRPGAGRPKGTKRAPASTTIRVAVAVVEECRRIDSAYRATAPAQKLGIEVRDDNGNLIYYTPLAGKPNYPSEPTPGTAC